MTPSSVRVLNDGELVISLCARQWRPIVVVHTSVLEAEVSAGLTREGVDAIIYKPTNSTELANQIQAVIERRGTSPLWHDRCKGRSPAAGLVEEQQTGATPSNGLTRNGRFAPTIRWHLPTVSQSTP